MSQRRFHNKSRHGCLQCKQNRIKCDERRPRCGRCEKKGCECSLVDSTRNLFFVTPNEAPQPPITLPENDRTSSPSSSDGPSNTLLDFLPQTPGQEHNLITAHFTDLERDRLRLMNQYSLYTAKTVAEITILKERDQNIWSHWVPELAFENDFLLHGLLSLSALHLAISGVSRKQHLVMAIDYHSHGVSLFRPHVPNIASNVYDAALAFTYVTIFYSFGIRHLCEPDADPITSLQQNLILLRRSAYLGKLDHERLLKSRWALLMLPCDPKSLQKPSQEIEDMISVLLLRASATEHAEMYGAAIQTLRDNFAIAATYQNTSLKMTWFPLMSPPEFWDMLSAGEPLAIAILANYAVLIYWLRHCIWLQGWGEETVFAIKKTLPLDWHECIAYAVRETESG